MGNENVVFKKAIENSENAIEQSKWNFDNKIDLFVAGLVARAIETGHSMAHVSDESPDNTNYILLRHLFETAVRLRYICLDPDNHFHEILLGSTQSTLKGIGRNLQNGESADMARARKKYLTEEAELINKVIKIQSNKRRKVVTNAHVPTVFDMCNEVGSTDLYMIYRMLSGVEHSSWAGLQATVYERSGNENKIVIGKDFDETASEFVWSNATVLLNSISDSITQLTSNRPQAITE